MGTRCTSLLVVSVLVALCGLLLMADPSRVAATHSDDNSQVDPPGKVENENKRVRVNLGKFPPLGLRDTRGNDSAPETNLSNPKMARTDALIRILDQEFATKDLPRSFWSLLDYLTAKLGAMGKELPFFVDVSAFSKDVQAVIDGQLPPPVFKLQPLPARMSVRGILQMALNEFDGGEGTLLIRQHRVEITTKKAAALPNLLKQPFVASFDRQPFEFVLDELSEITGVSVVIDARAKGSLRTPVTARFRNDVPLLEALRMLTESAGLKLVEHPGGPGPIRALFVTTPEHAQSLR